MKKIRDRSPYGIPFLIGLVALAAVIGVSFAIYTNQGYKKGVAITAENIAMFSSNLLDQITESQAQNASNFEKKEMYVTTEEDSSHFTFDVYNYEPNTPTRVNPNDIRYTLTVEIQGLTENTDVSGYSVNNEQFDGLTCVLPGQTLHRGTIHSNNYVITLPKAAVEAGNVKFAITAKPEAGSQSAVNSMCLAALVTPYISSSDTPVVTDWSGHWVEKQTEGIKPSDCSAFNYEISGVGKGTITLAWNTDALSIDTKFRPLGLTVSENSVSFQVDSDIQDVYNIRFYRTATAFETPYEEDSFKDWPALVSFTPESTS